MGKRDLGWLCADNQPDLPVWERDLRLKRVRMGKKMKKEILEQTENYYSQKIETFGATSRGVDWNSEESQRIRFDQLTGILDRESGGDSFSICDYGCGYGSYYEYLADLKYDFDYTGLDVSAKMLAAAQEKYGNNANAHFFQGFELKEQYDYIVASGIFNVKQKVEFDEWTSYMTEILDKFHKRAKKGFAFNCLTKYSDMEYMKDYLYYADPLHYFDYCKSHFSRNVALLHDYDLYEFTILVRKQFV